MSTRPSKFRDRTDSEDGVPADDEKSSAASDLWVMVLTGRKGLYRSAGRHHTSTPVTVPVPREDTADIQATQTEAVG